MNPVTMYARCATALKLKTIPTKNELKRCRNCSFKTVSKLLYLRHFCGTKEKAFSCLDCARAFATKQNLQRHTYTQHLSSTEHKWLKCDACDYKTLVKFNLTNHKYRRHTTEEERSEMWLNCGFCNFRTLLRNDLRKHVYRKHAKTVESTWYNCPHCDFKTTVKYNVKRHVTRIHTKVEKVQCDICNSWICGLDLKQHMQNVHSGKPKKHKCDLCEESFKLKVKLEYHQQHEHQIGDGKWTQCPHCEYKSRKASDFKSHLFRKHQIGEKDFGCDLCEFKTYCKSALKVHVYWKHTKCEEMAWYKCGACGYKKKNITVYKKHLAKCEKSKAAALEVENKRVWVSCGQCEERFETKRGLQNHLKTH